MSFGLGIAAGGEYDAPALAAFWSGQCRLLGWGHGPARQVANGTRAGEDHRSTVLLHPGSGRIVSGRRLRWIGPGEPRAWELPIPAAARRVAADVTWATLDDIPVVAARWLPEGQTILCGVDPADICATPEIGAVLRRALIASQPAAAWLDLGGTVAVRMDDPGASASVHLDPWSYEKLSASGWEAIGNLLERRDARMTIAYTPGWVDDGDPERGELRVGGRAVERSPGAVHPSPRVRYRGSRAPSADCEAEFRAITALRGRGLCSVELHGYTHVHPELERWARAPSRHEKLGWYRELGPEIATVVADRALSAHPVSLGLELFRRHFDESPSVLVCPGNAWSEDTLDRAHALGLEAVAADGLAVRHGQDFGWIPGLVSRPLEAPSARALAVEAPVVACLHDRDVALGGIDWMNVWLERWRAAGAERFVDLRELTSVLGLTLGLGRDSGGWRLEVARERGPALGRSLPVLVRAHNRLDAEMPVVTPEGPLRLAAEPVSAGISRVLLPAGL
jgi:hypothetical protein